MKGKEPDELARQGCGVASQCAGSSPRGCLSTSSSESRHCPRGTRQGWSPPELQGKHFILEVSQLLPHRSIPFESLWSSHATACTETSCFT